MKRTKIQFQVIVTEVVTTTEDGQEPVVEVSELADTTAGPEETAVILEALAGKVRGSKKSFAVRTLLDAVVQAGKAEDEKRRSTGRPTLRQEWDSMVAGRKPASDATASGN